MALSAQEAALRPITACFTGHRQLDIGLPVLGLRLDAMLEKLYQQGFRRFLCGGALGFDMLAAERVIAMKERHGDAALILALPHADQAKAWPVAEGQRYERIIYHADETHVLSPVYFKGCMMMRNRFMVDRSSFVLCYLRNTKGGTAATVTYASKQEIPLLNLAMEDACAAFADVTSV